MLSRNSLKGRMNVRPFVVIVLAALLLGGVGLHLSAGLPWGVDDGVKRLMAADWVSSGGKSVALGNPNPAELERRFFSIPPPFAEASESGYRGIFPCLFPVLGGLFVVILGNFGFYFLPALSLLLLLFFFFRLIRRRADKETSLWACLMLAGPLLFYGLTFWEHPLALLALVPLFSLLQDEPATRWRWFIGGLGFGLAIYLRPETILFFPWLLICLFLGKKVPWSRARMFLPGLIIIFVSLCLLEKIYCGRWWPPQIWANLNLLQENMAFFPRLLDILQFVFNSPFPWYVFAGLTATLFAAGWISRRPVIFQVGLPTLVLIVLFWDWDSYSAYGLTEHSQGLFFAWPWITLALTGFPFRKPWRDPLFLLGWGFIVLLYLLAPDKPGMHWGPRFLFPALVPLLLYSAKILQGLGKRKAIFLLVLTSLTALMNAGLSLLALAERGQAGKQAISAISTAKPEILILDRWHAGADLQSLWGKSPPVLLWVEGIGDLEELLVQLQESGQMQKIAWFKQEKQPWLGDLPVQITSKEAFPRKAGWGGELWRFNLMAAADGRWGTIYWHAARRRAEKGELDEALNYLQKALVCLPEEADLRYDLAVCLGRLGRTEAALEQLQVALRLVPAHARALTLWWRLRHG